MRKLIIKGLKVIGPGIIFASLSIGETHMALLTYAGALFGHTLLWLVLLVHIGYYPNFEYGARYAVATGETLIDGYSKSKAGRFLSRVFILFLFVTPPMVMSSLLGVSSSVLYAAIPAISFRIWCVLLFVLTVSLVLAGKYKTIERISKLLVLIIVLTSMMVFIVSPPQLSDFMGGLVPSIPAIAGVWVVVVAILRVPSDPAVSVFISEWAREKRNEWMSGDDIGIEKQNLKRELKKSLIDMRLGMGITAIVAVIFLSAGATVLRPLGIVPEGVEVSLKLSEMYTHSLGRWVFPVFIITLFAAFWGGYLAVMDGIKRLFINLIQRVFNTSDRTTQRLSVAYILLVTTTGLLMATIVQRPMMMVVLAVSIGLINYPLVFGLNIYCVTKQVDDEFKPGRINLAIALLGFAVGVTGLVLLILVRVLKVVG